MNVYCEIRSHSTCAMTSSHKKRSFEAAFKLTVVDYAENNSNGNLHVRVYT